MTTATPGYVPVVIIGAGPTGTAVATLLAQYGFQSLLLDRYQKPYPQPRAVHLDDEINRIIARLGIAEEFTAISRPALGLRLLDDEFRVLAEFHRGTDQGVYGFPQANMFDQPELEALLRSNLKNHPSVLLRGDVEVTGVTQQERGVKVTFADRATSETQSVHAAYALGCDGANSITRASIGATLKDLRFQQRWLVVDVATDAELNQWDGVHQVCSSVRAGTYMRIGTTRYRWEFRLLDAESADDYRSLAALRQLIDPWIRDISDQHLTVLRVAEYTFRAQVADRWRDRNILLLGDAVHLTPPFIGQGMGAGLRDAMNLAWKLAAVLNNDLPDSTLETYEIERKPHAQAMIRLALAMGWAMTSGGRLGMVIRRAVAPRLRFIPGLRRRVEDSTTPALRRSSLITKSRRPRELAGSLCPNPVLDGGIRLDAILGGGFALITARPLDPERSEQLCRRGAKVITANPGTELARWLHSGRATAAIIRPDRTVMQTSRRLARLCSAVPRFMSPELTRRIST